MTGRYVMDPEPGPFVALFQYENLHSRGGIPYGVSLDVREWCIEQFGPMDAKDAVWVFSGKIVAFRDADAAFHFRLRWC